LLQGAMLGIVGSKHCLLVCETAPESHAREAKRKKYAAGKAKRQNAVSSSGMWQTDILHGTRHRTAETRVHAPYRTGLERCPYLRCRIAGWLFRYFPLQPAVPFLLWRYAERCATSVTRLTLKQLWQLSDVDCASIRLRIASFGTISELVPAVC
jgi:hypothetical protein